MSSKNSGQCWLLGVLCVAMVLSALWNDATLWGQDSRPADPPAAEPKGDPPTSQPAKPRPELDIVIDNMVKAMGGEKLSKLETSVRHGSMSIPEMGLKGTVEMYFKAPNLVYLNVNMGALGQQQVGCDGETCWSIDSQMGPRILAGEERDGALKKTLPDRVVRVREEFPKRAYGDNEIVNGRPCFALVLTNERGREETWMVDQEDWLVRRTTSVTINPTGEIPTSSDIIKYETFDGIPVAVEIRERYPAGIELVFKTTKIEFGAELAADRFTLPPAVQELVDKEKAEKEAAKEKAEGRGKPTFRPGGDAGGGGKSGEPPRAPPNSSRLESAEQRAAQAPAWHPRVAGGSDGVLRAPRARVLARGAALTGLSRKIWQKIVILGRFVGDGRMES